MMVNGRPELQVTPQKLRSPSRRNGAPKLKPIGKGCNGATVRLEPAVKKLR